MIINNIQSNNVYKYKQYAVHEYRSNDRNKLTKLLLRIFDNIIKNPNNPKYQNLNYNTIYKKFVKCKSCVDLLICSGFYKINYKHWNK